MTIKDPGSIYARTGVEQMLSFAGCCILLMLLLAVDIFVVVFIVFFLFLIYNAMAKVVLLHRAKDSGSIYARTDVEQTLSFAGCCIIDHCSLPCGGPE